MNNLTALTVVIPAYNEQQSVGHVITDLIQTLERQPIDFEILVVDDGSDDNTAIVSERAGATVLSVPANMGYGLSLRRGILAAKYEHILICDADGTYPIQSATKLLELASHFDMVIGQRTGQYFKSRGLKSPMRWGLRIFSSFVVGRPVPDVNSGFRVFKKAQVLKYFRMLSSGFSFTTGLTLAMMSDGLAVYFLPISYGRRSGKSKIKTVRDSLRILQVLVQAVVRHNPLKLFLLPVTVLSISGISALVASILWWNTIWLLISAVLLTGSITVFALGLVAESLRTRTIDE